MERVRRLRELWSWLPAFRAAAETEHLPTASDLLHVSASSISRTVRLLEAELGTPLFERSGRAMKLSRAGHRLLGAVRDAMRIVDEGVDAVARGAYGGTVDVAAPGSMAGALVVPILERLAERAPELVLEACTGVDAAEDRLLRGQLDVAITEDATPHEHLTIERLCRLRHGVYCGAPHPLALARDVTLEELEAHAFVAAPADHWPLERRRRVAVRAADALMAAEICADGRHLAVLPDIVARTHPRVADLRELPVDPLGSSELYLVYRRPVADHARTELLLAALRERAEELTEGHAPTAPCPTGRAAPR